MIPLEMGQIQAKGEWIICEAMVPVTESPSGLWLGKDMDKDVVTEGVAIVRSIGEGKVTKKGTVIPPPVKVGDKVIYKGYLRYAHQMGTLFGHKRDSRVFAIKSDDLQAVTVGTGFELGHYGEYKV